MSVLGDEVPRRLYRGLSRPYRTDQGLDPAERLNGRNFTDCPAAAMRFAPGSRGVVLVLEVPPDGGLPVHRAIWGLRDAGGPKRFIAWGDYDQHLVAVIPAKDLRRWLRELRIGRRMTDGEASRLLTGHIDTLVKRMALERSEVASGVTGARA